MLEYVGEGNTVAAIRVSSARQVIEGDSPEAQREQITRYAQVNNLAMQAFFTVQESASQEDIQPMQPIIDYCKNPKHKVENFIIKSIDRFTRGGSYQYSYLKMQLECYGVKLIDIHGVIRPEKVNTLEHLGEQYRWSVYEPSKKTEILEAERARDEMRDIMTRMIGAEIRYAQMGYWVRRAPYGFQTDKAETINGKRCVLVPHPQESALVIKMFKLRARGTMTDQEIVDEVNRMGYKSRIDYIRDKQDRTKIVRLRGGVPLTVKALHKYLRKPIYAGVNGEKWTHGQPVKCRFNGLVSIDVFNKANRGKIVIAEKNGLVAIYRQKPDARFSQKNTYSAQYPYKKVVRCSTCSRALLGSASRGKSGKHYPAYHCSNYGHHFRVPRPVFNETVDRFLKRIQLTDKGAQQLSRAVLDVWQRRQQELKQDEVNIDAKIQEFELQAKLTADKLKFLNSKTAIKYMEEDIMRAEAEIHALREQKAKTASDQSADMPNIMSYLQDFLEHFDEYLINRDDEVEKAKYFGVLFNEPPTFEDVQAGTHEVTKIKGLNELFKLKNTGKVQLVGEEGLEPSRAKAHQILSLACIPISPLAHSSGSHIGYKG